MNKKVTFKNLLLIGFSVISLTSCNEKKKEIMNVIPPKAPKHEKILEKFGDKRIDNYFWMNERDSPEVLAYLNAENEYYQKMTASTKDFENKLFEEMKSRIKEDDSSVPYKHNGYWYSTRFEQGKDYPIYTRRKGSLDAPEEILFNVNQMAEGHAFYRLADIEISPDNKWSTFSVDTQGRNIFHLYIKNLETGEIISTGIKKT